MNISILIVDDDMPLVERIVNRTDFARLGVQNVLTASNIRQAKELLAKASIQVLLCDIEMPQGSGLELLEWVRERGLPVQCIFLSSYAHFGYAQKAMSLDTANYLVKPVSTQELEAALEKVVDRIRNTSAGPASDRTELWEQLLLSQDAQQSAAAMQALRLQAPDALFSLCLVRAFPDPAHAHKKDSVRFDVTLKTVWEQRIDSDRREACISLCAMEWLLVLRASPDGREQDMAALCASLRDALEQPVCLYAGKIGPLASLERSMKTLEAIEQTMVARSGAVLREEAWAAAACASTDGARIAQADPEGIPNSASFLRMLSLTIAQAEQLWGEKQLTIALLEQWRSQIISTIYQYLHDRGKTFDSIFEAGELHAHEKNACATVDGWLAFVTYVYERLEGNQQSDSKQESVVTRLKEHIAQNLGGDLSRKALAATVYLTEDYISRIFMQATGTSIVSYISGKRIQKAKEMLAHTDLSVGEVASKVGYSNFSYFSKTFRDYEGCTPNEYRRKAKTL